MTQEQREWAAVVLDDMLEKREEIIRYYNANYPDAIRTAIKHLRTNPCDNCVGPGLAIAHGYTDMRVKQEDSD